jgi:uncharacterized protein
MMHRNSITKRKVMLMNKKVVSFIGRTGSGKTSTINRLFALDWNVGHDVATTKALQRKLKSVIFGDKEYSVEIIDTPGIGESIDVNYSSIYKEAIDLSECIIWLYQADVRYFSMDQRFFLENNFTSIEKTVIIGLNQVDNIHPFDWDKNKNCPSELQMKNIDKKVEIIKSKFNKYINSGKFTVLPYSAKYSYGTECLLAAILS